MRVKSMQNVPRAKNSKITEAIGRNHKPNHRSPIYKTKRTTTMLESRNKERKQK